MINACFKQLKASLVPGFRKVGFPIALIVGTCVKFPNLSFFNFLDLDEFLIISSALLPSPLITSSLPTLNAFRADFSDDPVFFDIEVSDAAILLKP